MLFGAPLAKLAMGGAAAIALLLAVLGGIHFYARAKLDRAAVQAAQTQEETRRAADEAARAAERDGAAGRLRGGHYLVAPVSPNDRVSR